MSLRLQLIEAKLLSINSAEFQNLCDAYLKLNEEQVLSFNKHGSQFGKQKTTVGTPDTSLRTNNGGLLFVEHTTKAEGLVDKIKGDIDSCTDEKKTEVSIDEISKIIICTNSKLNAAQETEIFQHARSKKVMVQIIGLDTLAQDICYKHLILAKEHLGVALDTGQILSIEDFIAEYNNKGGSLSTPLDNEFLNRQTELLNIKTTLAAQDLLIINGAPGVGKTKIAIEAIREFIVENNDYGSYVIAKKDVDIFEDLKINLHPNKNYILLIDDANRQLQNFNQIIGVFKQYGKGKIKLVITVRDYALEDVKKQCAELEVSKIDINKFTDDEIEKLISSDSFKIRHSKFQRKIKDVSNGNARLAVMAARLANKDQWKFVDSDVFELYDSYFQTFIKDIDFFKDEKKVKILGLISFFFTIHKDDKKFIEKLLSDFQISEHDFFDTLEELEKIELLETKYNTVRVSEQIMATYFFYKTFIKDDLLSLKKLLDEYYNQNYLHRFKESIISSNNLFYYTNQEILNKISITLADYLESIKADDKRTIEFYSLFWVYKREEFLLFFLNRTKALQEPTTTDYITEEDTRVPRWHKDEVVQNLSKLFDQMSESFLPAVELAFEYIRKKPEIMPEFVRTLKEDLMFTDEDHSQGFQRQVQFFNLLAQKIQDNNPHYLAAFFALSKTFLQHHFTITRGGRKGTIIISEFPIPFNEPIKKLRSCIWNTIFELFKEYPDKAFKVISHFSPGIKGPVKGLIEWDFDILFPFLDANLDVNNFQHVHFVQNTVSWISKKADSLPDFQNLKAKFISEDYKIYRKLDFSSHRGKQDYQFKDSDEFRRLKESDVKKNFVFKNEGEIDSFLSSLKNILTLEKNQHWFSLQAIDIIAAENFRINKEIGFLFMKKVLENYNEGQRELYSTFVKIANESEQDAIKAWDILENWKHEQSVVWKFTFLRALPDSLINGFFCEKLLQTINSIERQVYLYFDVFDKFSKIKENILEEVLETIVNKNEVHKLGISLPFHFFETYSERFKHRSELLEKAYFQYEDLDNNMDSGREGLKALISSRPEFLLCFIKKNFPEGNWRNDDGDDKLEFVWGMVSLDIMESAINQITDSVTYYGIGDHSINMFFHGVTDEQRKIILPFLKEYITRNSKDTKRMNAIFNVIRKRMPTDLEHLYHHYLSANADEETYKEIMWRGNGGGVQSADVIFGDIQAEEWKKMLAMTERHPSQLELIPIKAYLKKQIEYGYRFAERERKEKFVESYFH